METVVIVYFKRTFIGSLDLLIPHSFLEWCSHKSTIPFYYFTLTNQHQTNIMTKQLQREQLIEDINSIVESFCMEMWEGNYPETQEELTHILCDAVYKNFPIN